MMEAMYQNIVTIIVVIRIWLFQFLGDGGQKIVVSMALIFTPVNFCGFVSGVTSVFSEERYWKLRSI